LRDALWTTKLTKKNEINIIFSDFNAKVGREAIEEVVGKWFWP